MLSITLETRQNLKTCMKQINRRNLFMDEQNQVISFTEDFEEVEEIVTPDHKGSMSCCQLP